MDIPLRCRCGLVRGVATDVGPATGNRVICHCDDCQTFARFLGGDGVMDAAGGTDIFQMAPASVRLEQGLDQVRCLRLSQRGLYRFYAECCRTPIGNMMGPKVPFIGVIHSCMDHAAAGGTRDDQLGPVLARVQLRFATGELPAGGRHKGPVQVIARVIKLMLGFWLAGKGKPSPFFDPNAATLRVPVRVLEKQERAALRVAPDRA